MLTPYVQDVAKWVNHYKTGVHKKQNKNVSDAETTGVPNGGSLAESSSMSVAAVEPKGPLPPVPSFGPTAALNSVTPSESVVLQAKFDAMRGKLSDKGAKNSPQPGRKRVGGAAKKGARKSRKTSTTPSSGGKKKSKSSSSGGSNGNGKKKASKKDLFGTPHDIFVSRTTGNGRWKSNKR